MIQLLTGENDFALKAALGMIRAEYIDTHDSDSVVMREGQELSVSDLPQLLAGRSLFSPEQLVVISGAADNKSVWEALPEQIEAADPELILVESKPDKRTRTYKWLQKHATTREYGYLGESDLEQWLMTAAHREGIDLAHDVARFLLSYAGSDQWRLQQELRKLALTGRPITRETIEDVIEPHPQASAFELLDAAIAQRIDRIRQLVGIVARSEDPYRFVGLLTSQVYALAVAHAAGDRPAAVIAKDAGIHPYVATKTQATARRLSANRLTLMIETIAALDRKLKRSGGDPWMLIGAALTKIAAR